MNAYRSLGATGLDVSVVGLGCAELIGHTGRKGQPGKNEAKNIIRSVRDFGCNFFDTADCYGMGQCEELLKDVVAGRPNQIVCTKVGHDLRCGGRTTCFQPEYLENAISSSRVRLGVESIDVLLLHGAYYSDVQNLGVRAMIEKVMSFGWVKHIGVSAHSPLEVYAAINSLQVEIIQIPYVVCPSEAWNRALDYAKEHRVGVIAREIFLGGMLLGKYNSHADFAPDDRRKRMYSERMLEEFASVARQMKRLANNLPLTSLLIASVLQDERVSTAIVGCRTLSQARAVFDGPKYYEVDKGTVKEVQDLWRSFEATWARTASIQARHPAEEGR